MAYVLGLPWYCYDKLSEKITRIQIEQVDFVIGI